MTVSQTSPHERRTTVAVPAEGQGARVFPIPPPVYYGAAFAAAMILQKALPLDIPGRPTTALVGAGVLVGALLVRAGLGSPIVATFLAGGSR